MWVLDLAKEYLGNAADEVVVVVGLLLFIAGLNWYGQRQDEEELDRNLESYREPDYRQALVRRLNEQNKYLRQIRDVIYCAIGFGVVYGLIQAAKYVE